jgi:hypothetical protein
MQVLRSSALVLRLASYLISSMFESYAAYFYFLKLFELWTANLVEFFETFL